MRITITITTAAADAVAAANSDLHSESRADVTTMGITMRHNCQTSGQIIK